LCKKLSDGAGLHSSRAKNVKRCIYDTEGRDQLPIQYCKIKKNLKETNRAATVRADIGQNSVFWGIAKMEFLFSGLKITNKEWFKSKAYFSVL
jgi:hypothetical protein